MYENWRGYSKHNKPDANENNVNSREKKNEFDSFELISSSER